MCFIRVYSNKIDAVRLKSYSIYFVRVNPNKAHFLKI